MLGLSRIPRRCSLLGIFEIVTTTLVLCLFSKKKLVGASGWQYFSGYRLHLLSGQGNRGASSFHSRAFGSCATLCGGLRIILTASFPKKSHQNCVVVKGFGSGLGALLVAVISRQTQGTGFGILMAMLLGFVAYGLSIFFYISAQRDLGAAKTSAFYSTAPFFGVIISLILYQELPPAQFWLALLVMIIATVLTTRDAFAHDTISTDMKGN